ncbi:MAG: flagellar assembly protein FliW [Nitrospirota bacterium]
MKIQTKRFGLIRVDAETVIELPQGLIGCPALTRFVPVEQGQTGIFRWWQSLDAAETAFVVVDPLQVVPEYDLAGVETELADLGLVDPASRRVVVLATISRPTLEAVTLNLAAPIIVNAVTRQGRQLVQSDVRYRVNTRLEDLVSPKRLLELAA